MNTGRNGDGKQPVTAVAGQGTRVEMDRELLHSILASAQAAMADVEHDLLGNPGGLTALDPPTATPQQRLDLRMAGVQWAQVVLTAELVDLLKRRPGLTAAESAAINRLISAKG